MEEGLRNTLARWRQLCLASVAAFAAAKDGQGDYVAGPLLDEAYRLKAERQAALKELLGEAARLTAAAQEVYRAVAGHGGPY